MKQVKGFTKEYYIEKCKDDGGVPILYSNMQEAVKHYASVQKPGNMMTLSYQRKKQKQESRGALMVIGF